jgi:asparagine synthase (glutamine-hydrolysing)
MCGIFGALSLGSYFTPHNYKSFIKATDLVSYRGPDASDYRTYDTTSKKLSIEKFNLFFGHRRLSIIDLSKDGVQPMELNGIHIVFNGEIFNYIELRDELKKFGTLFKTDTDTEVILRVYEKFGTKGFSRFNGMWAFLIYDSHKNIFIASRDRFSIKPLFWLTDGKQIYFASEIKQLTDFLPSKNVNKEVLNLFLNQGLLDINENSFFEGINKVEAKHNLIIDLCSGNFVKEKYWDYSFTDSNQDLNLYERFLELFNDSVKLRLRSDVKLGSLLSGGLDSSAISVVGKKYAGQSFNTYTVITNSKEFSEEKYSDIVVNHSNLNNKKLLLKSSDIKKYFDEVLYFQDEPFSNFVVMAHYSILKKIKEETDITVILSGQGGDEVLLGYLRHFFFNLKLLYKSKKYVNLIREILFSLIYRTVLTQWKLSSAKRYLPVFLKRDKNYLLNNTILENTWDNNDLKSYQIDDIDKYSVPILTRYEDRNSMAHSLEIRLPFLDHRIVEFLLNIDCSFKIRNGYNKYILRNSMQELPNPIRWRRDKKGFSLPEETWLKDDFKDDIISNFNQSKLEEMGIIDASLFLDYYKNYLSGNRRIHNFDISRVYIAEKWAKKNFS